MTLPKNRKKFEELIKKWVLMEDSTIDAAGALIGKSSNPMVKAMIELLKMDSEKHKYILETIRHSLNETVTFSTDDLQVVDAFIEKHITLEKKAMETAEQALAMSSLPIPRLLLHHLLEDEKSHDAYIGELNSLKEYMAKDT